MIIHDLEQDLETKWFLGLKSPSAFWVQNPHCGSKCLVPRFSLDGQQLSFMVVSQSCLNQVVVTPNNYQQGYWSGKLNDNHQQTSGSGLVHTSLIAVVYHLVLLKFGEIVWTALQN